MKIHIRMLGILYTYRRKQGLSTSVELQLPSSGKSALEIAQELELPIDKIEAVFCNNTIYSLDHRIMPGDRVAFVPHGTPGPHRYTLGIKQAGDRQKKAHSG
jgi:molybdopterin converting factor small subunit